MHHLGCLSIIERSIDLEVEIMREVEVLHERVCENCKVMDCMDNVKIYSTNY
jgi:hypothetical protein